MSEVRKIGNLEIFTDSNSQLVVSKKKLTKYFKIGLTLLIPIVLLGLSIKPLTIIGNFSTWILIGIPGVVLIIIVVQIIRRTIREYRDFVIYRDSGNIFINSNFFCEQTKLIPITILQFIDRDGASSYNIVLSNDKQTFSIAMGLSKTEVLELANIVSVYLDKEFVVKQGKLVLP
jgi:membrane protein YdbS with pleckstrin-like domain